MNVLVRIFEETYRIVLDSGFFILLGFLLAGLLHELVDTARIGRALGGRSLGAILKAAVVGGPLPLCSCGVLPMAVALRKKGASREATVSFLISTPETSEEAILLTWGLLGPVMALVRPVVGVVTAIVAGLVSLVAGGEDDRRPTQAGEAAGVEATPCSTEDGCGTPEAPAARGGTLRDRAARVVRYAFVTMVDELAFWMLLAFLATGVLAGVLPQDFFLRFLPWPILTMVLMALVGLPMYVCASASTPIAAAMIAKGLDPGSALVFMLTGPATNASTIAVVARLFGRRFVGVYVGSIVGVAIASGLLLNAVVGAGLVPAPGGPEAESGGVWAVVRFLSAFAFLALMAFSFQRRGFRPGWNELKGHALAFRDLVREQAPRRLPRRALAGLAAAVLLLLWGRSALLVVRPGETGLVPTLGKVTSSDLAPGRSSVPPSAATTGRSRPRGCAPSRSASATAPPAPPPRPSRRGSSSRRSRRESRRRRSS
ncbi:MAG TPA: SO_0444 family Cu/Zn efflux transporter [Thermoanaerobaculia bacterium]|nr:SO_0444 family Cu/Zn efflux transporter [Thermoanaerobaculia bacterium]